jgi:hypothetical protein
MYPAVPRMMPGLEAMLIGDAAAALQADRALTRAAAGG